MDKSRLFVQTPLAQLSHRTNFLLKHHLQPELALNHQDLQDFSIVSFRGLLLPLHEAGLSCTVHAPSIDINPGAIDPLVREVTAKRLIQSFEIAATAGAELVVVHPGYDHWRYGGNEQLWLDKSLKFWPPLIKHSTDLGLRIVLENVFDTQPQPLLSLLECLNLGFCLDIGHLQLFSTLETDVWLHTMGEYLVHLHLHDNHGNADEHLPLGEGCIDFGPLFEWIQNSPPKELTGTLELRSEAGILASLKTLSQHSIIC